MTDLLSIAKNRKPAEELLAGLKDDDLATSLKHGQKLVQLAKNAGLNVPDYLRLAIDTTKGEFAGADIDGFEAALAFLDLPVRENYAKGIVLQAASETFNTYPGTRALFAPVINNILQWKYRQDTFESVDAMIAQSRGISGNEMITTVVDDNPEDYQQTGVIAEGA